MSNQKETTKKLNPNKNTLPNRIPIEDGDFKPFVGITERWGRAEFSICPKWERGKLVKLSIYPLQQEDKSYFFEWEGKGKMYFTVQSYEGLDDPRIWMHCYCKEHKCQTMRMYVPNGAKFLWFQIHGDNITIGFTSNSH